VAGRVPALGAEGYCVDGLVEEGGEIARWPPAKGERPVPVPVQVTEVASSHVGPGNGYTDWVHPAMTDATTEGDNLSGQQVTDYLVEPRRIELPTSALRTRRSPS
jgi:hypothetical protein